MKTVYPPTNTVCGGYNHTFLLYCTASRAHSDQRQNEMANTCMFKKVTFPYLETNLDNSCQHRDLGELNSTEDFYLLREQFLDIAH